MSRKQYCGKPIFYVAEENRLWGDWFNDASWDHFFSGWIGTEVVLAGMVWLGSQKVESNQVPGSYMLTAVVVANGLHLLNELYENTIGFPPQLTPLIHLNWDDRWDCDSLQGFLGDSIMCFLGSLMAVLIHAPWSSFRSSAVASLTMAIGMFVFAFVTNTRKPGGRTSRYAAASLHREAP